MAGVRIKGESPIKEELLSAANFFLSRLLHSNLRRRLDVLIEVGTMKFYHEKYVGRNGVKYQRMYVDWGYTHHEVDDHRNFEVRLNKENRRTLQLRTLAHELVHVAQFAKYRLIDTEDDKVIWEGQEVDLPYKEEPWEIEAKRMAKNLLASYKRSIAHVG